MPRLKFSLLTAAILILFGIPLLTSAQSVADPLSVANSLIANLNAEKSEEALALFSDDAVIRYIPALIPGSPFSGKEQIRKWVLSARGVGQFNQIIGTPVLVGDKLTGTYRVSDNRYRKLGIDFVEFNGELVVQEGKIKALTATLTPATLAKLQKAAAGSAVPQQAPATGNGAMVVAEGTGGTGVGGLIWWVLPLLAGLAALSSLVLYFFRKRVS